MLYLTLPELALSYELSEFIYRFLIFSVTLFCLFFFSFSILPHLNFPYLKIPYYTTPLPYLTSSKVNLDLSTITSFLNLLYFALSFFIPSYFTLNFPYLTLNYCTIPLHYLISPHSKLIYFNHYFILPRLDHIFPTQ